MSLWRTIKDAWRGTSPSDAGLELAPEPLVEGKKDWRKKKLRAASAKYGRAFKCAGKNLPHEVLKRGEPPVATVTALKRRA